MEDIQFFGPFEFLVIENYNIGQTMIYTRIRTFDVRRNIDSTKPEDIIMVVLKILREMMIVRCMLLERIILLMLMICRE